MPNIKSAIKRVKVLQTKTARNQMLRTSLKTSVKKFDAAILSGDAAATTEAYKAVVKKIDQSAAKGILHKNTAARKKSQIAKKVNATTTNA